MADNNRNEQMNIVIAGHVDHGKSTVVGRLLADTGSLPEGKLDQVRALCELNSKPFEYAFLIDAFKDEMAQGITIDAARVFFKTKKRHYIIIDAPGHIEFLKNMVTGASRAEAGLLVIDAEEGVRENSRRHGYMLSMLGMRQIAVLVNKMDLVQYDQETFNPIVEEYTAFLRDIEVEPACFIPVSGREGDNIASLSDKTPWYQGNTVLQVLDTFTKERPLLDKPFRMPVQGVYKFTNFNDKRRLISGSVESGVLSKGEEVVFYPSGKRSRSASLEIFNAGEPGQFSAGDAASFTLEEQIFITRGELACKTTEPAPEVSTRLRCNVFWMGREPLVLGKPYHLKIGTAKVPMEVEEITRVIDASSLNAFEKKNQVERHDVAECIFKTKRAVAFDLAERLAPTSRFVIVDDYEIRGGGIIREGLKDQEQEVRQQVIRRNLKWEVSRITPEERAEKFNQNARLILITGEQDVGKKKLAKTLEDRLFQEGKMVYFLGISNVLYGVDADIKVPGGDEEHRREHLRRLGEVANLMLEAGLLLVVTAVNLSGADMSIIETAIGADRTLLVWMGEGAPQGLQIDLLADTAATLEENTDAIKALLQDRNVIFRP